MEAVIARRRYYPDIHKVPLKKTTENKYMITVARA
jgi:hypothetical protein